MDSMSDPEAPDTMPRVRPEELGVAAANVLPLPGCWAAGLEYINELCPIKSLSTNSEA